MEESAVHSKFLTSYIYHSHTSEEDDIPTAICINGGDTLLAGYVNTNALVAFDL